MSELSLRETGALSMAESESGLSPTVASLVAWAESARAAHQIATSLVGTSFVPEAFRNKPGEATAAILSGAEVGLSPMASLRSFDIIQGTAAPRAGTLRAVVQAKGHDMWVEESTDTRAIVAGQRAGSNKVQKSTWTMDRAKRLKLAGKSNWQNQPQAMLIARATSECARLIASDAILGIPYSSEEIADGVDFDAGGEVTATVAPARRTARRAPLATVPEPAFEPDETPLAPHDERFTPAEPATRAQVTKLNIQLQVIGYDDRDEKLAFLSEKVGRPIASSNDLTKAEASSLIDELEASNPPEDPPFEDPA
jgi:hypothetical protein